MWVSILNGASWWLTFLKIMAKKPHCRLISVQVHVYSCVSEYWCNTFNHGLGALEWCCYFYWHGGFVSSWCRAWCACDKVFCIKGSNNKCTLYNHPVLKSLNHRYFTGHTKNPDGSVQFRAGTTGAKQGFMGAIRILTIAVCNFNLLSTPNIE